jgi:spore coat protein U-like protein
MGKFLSATLAGGFLAAGAANAGTATSSFQVTATVLSTCSATASAVAFPNYTPGGGVVTANGTISVKCTNTSPYTVALNAGSSTGDAFTQRLMTLAAGTATLQYNLYTTAGFATVFGDGTGTTAKVPGTGAGLATAVNTTVYGQLLDSAANQAAAPGNYSDTITVTISY